MRNELIRLAIKYRGDYRAVFRAVENGEKADDDIRLQEAVTILDDDYPDRLRELKYPPYVLFYQGDRKLLNERAIAVIGSRLSCKYGIKVTEEIVRYMADDNVIVSGMARGIDSVAHCHGAKTIGVLGNGLDVIYPRENEKLYQYMKQKQLLISEYPLGVKPEKYHFPFRNRIIAALAEKILVTQAEMHSGTFLTVDEGLKLGREIYAVPYPYDSVRGRGCNYLIEQGASILTAENIKYCRGVGVDK